MDNFNSQIFEYLKNLNVIDIAALEKAYKEAQSGLKSFTSILLERELITDENLGRIISDIFAVPLIDLNNTKINLEALIIIPEIVARKQKIIAFDQDKAGLKVAMINPANTELKEFIAKKAGMPVVAYYATDQDIEESYKYYNKEIEKTFEDILGTYVEDATKKADKEVSISKIVDTLIEYAYQNKASDIHIEPFEDKSLVRFRIDGVLHDILTLPKNLHDQMITRIKVSAKLRTDEHLSAQDGKMQTQLERELLDIRISIVPIVEGEKAVMRLLSSRSRQFSLQELGMGDSDLEKVRKAYSKPTGMILSTGPTGSGKTTTIYSILKILNSRDVNIATIEDPVEYDIEGINQIQVNNKTNLTFASGLRSILRQDPNIIFVGEIRDEETAGIAVNSALTGHLVLSTLHTNDAPTTLPRLIDMNIEPFLVSSTVNVIIAQRLVRKICQSCKVSLEISYKELVERLGEPTAEKYFKKSENKIRIYEGKGCDICHNTGFLGRIGIFEVLEMTPKIKDLINTKADSDTIKVQAIKDGMDTMFDDGIKKVVNGMTTFDEIMRVTKF